MSRKGLVFILIMIFLLVLSGLSLWTSWNKFLCSLIKAESVNDPRSSLLALVSWWFVFLTVAALIVLLIGEVEVLVGIFLLVGLGMFGFSLRGSSSLPLSVVSAAVLFSGLLVFSLNLRKEVVNHIKFSAGHLLSPNFKTLGLFLVVMLSFYVFWVSRGQVVDFRVTIPDFLMEMIIKQMPADFLGETLGESTDGQTLPNYLSDFLEGRAPLPEELRAYLGGKELPEETRQFLEEQGLPADLVQSLLSTIEVDEEGKIREPLTGGGAGLLIGGLKVMIEDQLNQMIEPYRGLIPYLLGGMSFTFLAWFNFVMVWLAIFFTWLLLKILIGMQVVVMEKETVEAERLLLK